MRDTVQVTISNATARDRLVEAGLNLLAREGLEALTLRGIAREAGVSHSAPRHTFPTRARLLAAVAREGYSELTRYVVDALGDHSTASVERLIDAATAYVQFADRRPAMYELMFRHDLMEGSGELLSNSSRPLFASMAESLSVVSGCSPADSQSRTVLIWTGLHGLVQLSRTGATSVVSPTSDVGELARRCVLAYVLGPHDPTNE
jgi:AcrR family transcriptional regulator